MVRIQDLDARQQFNKRNKDDIVKLLMVAAVITVNLKLFKTENVGCGFEAS